jgi:hypothetical protein
MPSKRGSRLERATESEVIGRRSQVRGRRQNEERTAKAAQRSTLGHAVAALIGIIPVAFGIYLVTRPGRVTPRDPVKRLEPVAAR